MADYSLLLCNIRDFLYKDNVLQYPGKGRVFYTQRRSEGYGRDARSEDESLLAVQFMENEIPFLDTEEYEHLMLAFEKKKHVNRVDGRLKITDLLFLGIHLGGWIPASRWMNGEIEKLDRTITSNLMTGKARGGTKVRRTDFVRDLSKWQFDPDNGSKPISIKSENDTSSSTGYRPITEYIVTRNHKLIKNYCPRPRKEHLKEIISDFAKNQPKASETTSLYSSDEGETIEYLKKNLSSLIKNYANASEEDKNWLLARALTWLIIGAFLQDHLDKYLIDDYMVPYLNKGDPSINEVRDEKTSVADAPPALTTIPPAVDLIGRENDIKAVHELLEKNDIVYIHAGGGVGKSAVAKKIANQIRKDVLSGSSPYEHVGWITRTGSLMDDLTGMEIPSVKSAQSQEEKYQAVSAFLQRTPTFLVIDNMDALPNEISYLNTFAGKTKILITTRADTPIGEPYELKDLDDDSALVLFYSCFQEKKNLTLDQIKARTDHACAQDIVNAATYNALFIELIGKMAKADHWKLQDLWGKLEKDVFGQDSKHLIKAGNGDDERLLAHIQKLY